MKIIHLLQLVCILLIFNILQFNSQAESITTTTSNNSLQIPSPYGGSLPEWAEGYNLGASQKDTLPVIGSDKSDAFKKAYLAGWFDANGGSTFASYAVSRAKLIGDANANKNITYKDIRNDASYSMLLNQSGGRNTVVFSFMMGYSDAVNNLTYNPSVPVQMYRYGPSPSAKYLAIDTQAYHDGFFYATSDKLRLAFDKGVEEGKKHPTLYKAFVTTSGWIRPPTMNSESNAYWFGVFEGANGHHCGN